MCGGCNPWEGLGCRAGRYGNFRAVGSNLKVERPDSLASNSVTGGFVLLAIIIYIILYSFQWRGKFAESGGAILLERKYFYGKKLKSYGAPLK